jgi:DNA-binding NarL/FixJ family response regulator
MIELGIVDDHLVFREALSHFLDKEKEFTVTITAHNGQDLLNKLLTCNKKPDVILLDIVMPIMNGKETMICLAKEYPKIKIIILSLVSG